MKPSSPIGQPQGRSCTTAWSSVSTLIMSLGELGRRVVKKSAPTVSPLPGTVRGRWSRASLSSRRWTSSTALGAAQARPTRPTPPCCNWRRRGFPCRYNLGRPGVRGFAVGSEERAGDVEPVLARREAEAHGRADRRAEGSAGVPRRAFASSHRAIRRRSAERDVLGHWNRGSGTSAGEQDVPREGGASNGMGSWPKRVCVNHFSSGRPSFARFRNALFSPVREGRRSPIPSAGQRGHERRRATRSRERRSPDGRS